MGDFDKEYADLKAEFKANVKLIQEILPNFQISDAKIDEYINKARFALHERAEKLEKNIKETELKLKGVHMPESYIRNMYTFYDWNAGGEEKNKNLLDNVNSPSEKGNLLRKQMFVDSLNDFQEIDRKKLIDEGTFDTKAEYALNNCLLFERGFEFQRTNRSRMNSLGFGFSNEQEENVKKIENKAVTLGGRGRSYLTALKSRLCLTFPFAELNDEDLYKVHSKLPRILAKKGMTVDKASKYSEFISTIFSLKMELNYEEPKKEHYEVKDAKDIMLSVPEMKEKFSTAYAVLGEKLKDEKFGNDPEYNAILTNLRDAIFEFSKVDGQIEPKQAWLLNYSVYNLRIAVNKYVTDSKTDDAAVLDLFAAIERSAKEELLFYTTLGNFNRMLGLTDDSEFFDKLNSINKEFLRSGLSLYDLRNLTAELHMTTEEYINKASAGEMSWNPTQEEKLKIVKDEETAILEKNFKDITSKYDIREQDEAIIKNSQLSLEELEALPCLQGLESPEERNEALHKYLDELSKYNAQNLPKEYADALAEEGLSLGDVKTLAIRQGVDVDTYMKRMMDAAENEEDLDRGVKEINENLRNSMKNPLEVLMADTMIELKEQSFEYGRRPEMEQKVARFVALKTIQKYLDVKNGEDFTGDPEKMEKFQKLSEKLDKYTDDVMKDDTFRYFIKSIKTADLSNLGRGGDLKPLEESYNKLFTMMANKELNNNYETAMGKMKTYTDWAIGRETFLGEKMDSSGDFLNDPKNPFNLSVTRMSLVTLSMGNMIKRGFDLEDILDPFKLSTIKRDIGSETFEQIQEDTPENRRKTADAYLKVLEKTIELANDKLAKMNSLTPKEVFENNDMTFMSITGLLKDASQELGTLNRGGFLNDEEKEKYQSLASEADAINKCYSVTTELIKSVADVKNKKLPENAMIKSIQTAVMNSAFVKVKSDALKNGNTISKQIIKEFNDNPGLKNTTLNSYTTGALAAGDFRMPEGLNTKIAESKTLRNKLAFDMFNGDFMKVVKSVNGDGETVLDMKYFNQFEKAAQKVSQDEPVREL